MTRQENILTLTEHLEHWKRLLSEKICDQDEGEKTIDALQNAIKELEQEHCDDCIRRSDMLDAVGHGTTYTSEEVQDIIDGMPSVASQPCGDCISRESVSEYVSTMYYKGLGKQKSLEYILKYVERLPPVTPQQKVGSSSENPNKWIPVKWHEITDEEREREGYPKDWACHLDCIMPYDGQRILITTKGGFVELDECYSDDGCTFSLDSGYDWGDDVVAWRKLPEPYKQEVEG